MCRTFSTYVFTRHDIQKTTSPPANFPELNQAFANHSFPKRLVFLSRGFLLPVRPKIQETAKPSVQPCSHVTFNKNCKSVFSLATPFSFWFK